MHGRQSSQSNPMMSISNSIVAGGTFSQNNHWHFHNLDTRNAAQRNQSGFEILKAAVSPAAFHNAARRFDPPRCYRNTRFAVIQKIVDWIFRSDDETRNKLVIWLNGAAGAGKSAVAQTLAELCHASGILLASFFFHKSDIQRNSVTHLVATIIYQIFINVPSLREHIVAKIEADPLIFSRSFHTQLMQLLVDPLLQFTSWTSSSAEARLPPLIILDGLDECIQRGSQTAILEGISHIMRNFNLPIRILVASRPEHDISTYFNSPGIRTLVASLKLDDHDAYYPSQDIQTYVRGMIKEIKKTHPLKSSIPDSWLHDDLVSKIVTKASGQFIYAATVVKYIGSIRHRPQHRLDTVLQVKPPNKSENLPFSDLNALYSDILLSTENIAQVLQVLSVFFILKDNTPGPPSVREMETLLSMEPGDIEIIMCDVRSLVEIKSVAPSDYKFIELSHLSLQDFLHDPLRCGYLHIDRDFSQAIFVDHFLRLLTTTSDQIAQCAEMDYLIDPDYGKMEYYWLTLRTSLHAIVNFNLRDILPYLVIEHSVNLFVTSVAFVSRACCLTLNFLYYVKFLLSPIPNQF